MKSKAQSWIKQVFSSRTPPTEEQSRTSAQRVRQDRADLVLSLQKDVRRLQQDIADLSNDSEAGEQEGNARQLASLHRDLKEKQAELAKYQARI